MSDQEAAAADDAGEREAWIAAAECEVRAQARPYQLVPLDDPARAWDDALAGAVDKSGRALVKAVRSAAQETARSVGDVGAEQRARAWDRALAASVRKPRYGQASPDRWLTAAETIARALDQWLSDDAISENERRELAWLVQLRRQRTEALETAIAAALNAAVAAEIERRSTPGAWEEERARRESDAESARQAEAGALVAGSLLDRLGAPEGYAVLEPYELDRDGVWVTKPSHVEQGCRERVGRIAYAPLIVTRVFADSDGEQMVELAWLDRAACVTRAVPRAVAKSGKALVKMLGDVNVPIVEADGKMVERYLAAIEADNRGVIERVEIARQLGWQPDGTFVTGQDAPRRVEPRYPKLQRAWLAAFHPRGTLEEWQSTVKLIESYPIPRIALSAGFATPLLEPLGVDSGTVDISGRSTRGKSTTARLPMSVWACPTEDGDGFASWRITPLAAELHLNLRNGLPAVFDDTRVVKEEEMVDKILYQVAKNRGTSRSGDYPSDLPWRLILVSTGEQPALSFTTHEGASARTLSLIGAPFGTAGGQSAIDAATVASGLLENYGTAGPAFAARLCEELTEPGGAERLKRRHAELVALHSQGSDISRRRAPLVGAMRLGEELAHEWGICPLPPLETEVWIEQLAVESDRDDRSAMALEIAREFVNRHPHRMWTERARPDGEPSNGWIGAYLDIDGRKTVALFPEALGEELARRGYKIDSVRRAWIDDKLITLEENGTLMRRRVPNRVRVYEFDRDLFDGVEQAAAQSAGDGLCGACSWPLGAVGHIDRCGAAAREEK